RKLKDGLSKDVALQEAKLDYLATASQLRAHPYFWAAYVNIGSTNPLKYNRYHSSMIYGAFVVLLIIIFLLKKKKPTPTHQDR
ncbi:MAG: CHAT domain-containing protein, partial [Bacteroidetes bacterium]|nr:CHAT domain-containing protein [Bacteroidota bacterium]